MGNWSTMGPTRPWPMISRGAISLWRNTTTEFGATTYTLAPSTPRVQSIYDTGGIMPLTKQCTCAVLDLTPGVIHIWVYALTDDNTAIAFGTTIENVFSGSGADDLFGNDADNEIHAGAGDDLIKGGRQ